MITGKTSDIQNAMSSIASWIGESKVKIIYKEDTCPCADIKKGIIYLPHTNLITYDDLMKLRAFVYHEAGHIVKTKSDKSLGALGEIQNALEDVRMEREIGNDYKGAKKVFAWAVDFFNKEVGKSVMSGGSIDKDGNYVKKQSPLWEALCAMMFKVRGKSPAWNVTPDAENYVNLCYDEFQNIRKCKTSKQAWDLAQVIYDILKKYKNDMRSLDQESGTDEQDENQENFGDITDDESKAANGNEKPLDGLDVQADLDEDENQDNDDQDNDDQDNDDQDNDDQDSEGQDSEGQDSEGQDSEGQDSDNQDSESQDSEDNQEGESQNSDNQEGESQNSDNQEGESQNSDNQDSEGQEGEGQDSESQEGEGQDSESQDSSEQGNSSETRDSVQASDKKIAEEISAELDSESEGVSIEEVLSKEVGDAIDSMSDEDKEYTSCKNNDIWEVPSITSNTKRDFSIKKNSVGTSVMGLSRTLEQALRSMASCRKNPNLESGKVDMKKLTEISKSLSKRVFYNTAKGSKLNTAISIVIDESGSMYNDVLEIQLLALALGETLDAISVPFEIIGASTSGETNGVTGFSRNNTIQYFVYKSFDENWKTVCSRIVTTDARNNHADGEVVEAAAMRLSQRQEERKIVFSLSDGDPYNGSCGSYECGTHLTSVCKNLRSSGIEVYGFGIGTVAPMSYYGKENFIYLDDSGKMGSKFFKTMSDIITSGKV